MSLTVRAVESAKPKDKPYKLADGQGLYLYVSTTGVKELASQLQGQRQAADAHLRTLARDGACGRQEGPQRQGARDTIARYHEAHLPRRRQSVAAEAPPEPVQPQAPSCRWRTRLERFVYPKIGDHAHSDQIKRGELVTIGRGGAEG
jgi:hypothetical protein